MRISDENEIYPRSKRPKFENQKETGSVTQAHFDNTTINIILSSDAI